MTIKVPNPGESAMLKDMLGLTTPADLWPDNDLRLLHCRRRWHHPRGRKIRNPIHRAILR